MPSYAQPVFVRIIEELETTGTFKLKKNNLRVIRGSGIDINYFKYHSEKTKNKVRLAYAGRILEDKKNVNN